MRFDWALEIMNGAGPPSSLRIVIEFGRQTWGLDGVDCWNIGHLTSYYLFILIAKKWNVFMVEFYED